MQSATTIEGDQVQTVSLQTLIEPGTALSGLTDASESSATHPIIPKSPGAETTRATARKQQPPTKADIRAKLCDLLTDRGYTAMRSLLVKAEQGQLRDADKIRLLDMLLKYSIGPVSTQELTGADGAPVKIQFGFATNKPEADLYLQDVRRRAEQYVQQTQGGPAAAAPALEAPAEPAASDNDHSDAEA